MLMVNNSGETIQLNVEWNGVIFDCPNFILREGQTFGEAARLSECMCELHRKLRTEESEQDLDT